MKSCVVVESRGLIADCLRSVCVSRLEESSTHQGFCSARAQGRTRGAALLGDVVTERSSGAAECELLRLGPRQAGVLCGVGAFSWKARTRPRSVESSVRWRTWPPKGVQPRDV